MTIRILPDVTVLFLLLFARIGTLCMLMPGIGEPTIPSRARLTFALLLTAVFYPLLSSRLPSGLANDTNRLIFALIAEVIIGVAIGLTARLLMSVIQIAGTAIASDIGLGFAQSVDPTMGQQGAIISSFLSVTGVTIIFATDLHHVALAGIAGRLDGQIALTGTTSLPALPLCGTLHGGRIKGYALDRIDLDVGLRNQVIAINELRARQGNGFVVAKGTADEKVVVRLKEKRDTQEWLFQRLKRLANKRRKEREAMEEML